MDASFENLSAVNHALRQRLLGIGQRSPGGTGLLDRPHFASPLRRSSSQAEAGNILGSDGRASFTDADAPGETNEGYFALAQRSEAAMRSTLDDLQAARAKMDALNASSLRENVRADARPDSLGGKAKSQAAAFCSNAGLSASADERAAAERRWRRHARATRASRANVVGAPPAGKARADDGARAGSSQGPAAEKGLTAAPAPGSPNKFFSYRHAEGAEAARASTLASRLVRAV
jgi:hypothetical protein